MTPTRLLLAAAIALLAPALTSQPRLTAEDVLVIDAALSMTARSWAQKTTAQGGTFLLLDRTMPVCEPASHSPFCLPVDETRFPSVQRAIPEVSKAFFDALVRRNGVQADLRDAPAADIVLTGWDHLKRPREDKVRQIYAFTSVPAYGADGTALIYVGYFCGGLCGEGNFVFLRKEAGKWKAVKRAMTWIS